MKLKKLTAPQESKRDKLLGYLASTMQIIPAVGGASASLMQQLLVTDEKKQTKEWQLAVQENFEAICTAVTALQMEEKPLSPMGYQIALLVCVNCKDGSEYDSLTSDEIAYQIGEDKNDVQICAYQLEDIGLVRTCMSTQSFKVKPTQLLYEKMDKHVFGWDTIEDAVFIAKYCVSNGISNARDVHGVLGWPLRRFNPAFVTATQFIPEGLIRNVDGVDYVVYGFGSCNESKAALNKLISKVVN